MVSRTSLLVGESPPVKNRLCWLSNNADNTALSDYPQRAKHDRQGKTRHTEMKRKPFEWFTNKEYLILGHIRLLSVCKEPKQVAV